VSNQAVATTQQNKAVSTKRQIESLLEGDQFKAAVAKVLPKHLPPERFIRVAITAMTRTPKLKECDQTSFFKCLLDLSSMGLEPDGRRAHLIPFENRKRGVVECQLIVDWKGLAELAMRSGVVSFLHGDIVCENDDFEYDRGELKKHKIDFKKDRGAMYAAYAICRFKDGTEQCCVMSKHEIDGIRARSRAGQSGPWVTDYNEMAKKTTFRRLSKWLPLSAEFRDALEKDADELEETRFQSAKPVIPGQVVVDAPAFELPTTTTASEETGDDGEKETTTVTTTATTQVQAPATTTSPVTSPVTTLPVQQKEPAAPGTTAAAPTATKEPEPKVSATEVVDPELGSQQIVAVLKAECERRQVSEESFCAYICNRWKINQVKTLSDLNEGAPQRVFKAWKQREEIFTEMKNAQQQP